MLFSVRVIGRIDLALQITEALRAEGFDAAYTTSAPTNALLVESADRDVDVVIRSSMHDAPLWRRAKKRSPGRPLVAIVEPADAATLERVTSERHGPDAWAIWPGPGAALASAVHRAVEHAGEQRRWNAGDVGRVLVGLGFALGYLGPLGQAGQRLHLATLLVKVLGAGLLAAGLFLRIRYSYHPRWVAVGASAALLYFGFAAFVTIATLRAAY